MPRKKPYTIDELITHATGGLRPSRRNMFRPAIISRLLRDPFGVWCDYHAPQTELVKEANGYGEAMGMMGGQFEREWIHNNYPEALHVKAHSGIEALRETVEAMLNGVPAIVSAQLWALKKNMYGRADMLIRDDSRDSDLGDYHYRVLQIRRAKKMKLVYSLQAVALNKLLEHMQGFAPSDVHVALHLSEVKIDVEDLDDQVEELVKKWRAIRANKLKPMPHVVDSTNAPWRVYANHVLEEIEDLTLLSPVDPTLREKIITDLGVKSISEVAKISQEKLSKVVGAKKCTDILYSAEAFKKKGPVFSKKNPFKISKAKRNLYFDFEFSDDMNRTGTPHVFLIGIWDAENEKFLSYLGKGAQEEGKIFKSFLEYVGSAKGARLIHWGEHEIQQMERVKSKNKEMAAELGKVIDASVDLHKVVRDSVYLPVPTYSLKRVAPALGFKWRQDNVGAFESMIYYRNYFHGKDVKSIKKVVAYNQDDCKAMWHVEKNLIDAFHGES